MGAFFSAFTTTGGGSVTFPVVGDVRIGIDRGDGELGTLLLPAGSDVRLGVAFGAGGIEVIGSLIVTADFTFTPGVSEPTWTEDSLSLFNDQIAEWGTTLEYKGTTLPCVRSPMERSFAMANGGYVYESDTDIMMLRQDARDAGLYAKLEPQSNDKRPIVTIAGVRHEIFRVVYDDDVDAAITVAAKSLK